MTPHFPHLIILHPSSYHPLIPHLIIPHPSSLILSSFIPHPSSYHPSFLILSSTHPSSYHPLIPHLIIHSSLILYFSGKDNHFFSYPQISSAQPCRLFFAGCSITVRGADAAGAQSVWPIRHRIRHQCAACERAVRLSRSAPDSSADHTACPHC